MRKKLLVLAAPFDYYKGGSEYQYRILEQHLRKRYDVFYLFRHPSRPRETQYITYDYAFRRRYREYLFTDAWIIYRKLKAISPDIVYKRGINYITAIGIHYAKRCNRLSVIHIASQRDLDENVGAEKSRIRTMLRSAIARYSIRHADRIVCQSNDQAVLIERNFGRRCDLVLPNVHPVPEGERWVKETPIKVVWVGNIKPLKQPEVFLELAAAFRADTNVSFIMVGRQGTGRHHTEFTSRLNDARNVTYLGELPLEEVNKILGGSHIFANTSEYEGFPNTFIQAWMREVPVVSLKVDPDALLASDGLGFCSGSLDQMKRDVGLLVKDHELRVRIGRRARAIADQKFGDVNALTFALAVSGWDSDRHNGRGGCG